MIISRSACMCIDVRSLYQTFIVQTCLWSRGGPLFLVPVCTDIVRCHSVLILRIYISKSKTDLGVNLNSNVNLKKFQH